MKKLYTTLTTLVLLMTALVANAQKTGKLNGAGYSLTYSFSGGTFISENDSYPGRQRSCWCEVTPGGAITFQAKASGKTEKGNPFHVHAEIEAYDGNSTIPIYSKSYSDELVSINYTIPKEATRVAIHARVGREKVPASLWINFKVVNEKPAPKPGPIVEHRPGISCVEDSHIRFNDLYGEVSYRCEFEEDDSYEYAEIESILYEDTRIKTKEESGAILGLEDMSTYCIGPETELVIHTEEKNISKIEILLGTMWSNLKRMAEGKSLEIELSQCVCGINGTIFACEDTGTESKVWLFAGKVTVTNKKTGKKTVLQPGQNITCKSGTSDVKTFNIEQGAKQFGIPMDHITNHYTNKPISKINLESICKPTKGTSTKKENKVSDKNSTAGKKPTIGKKPSTDKNTSTDKNSNTGKKPTIKKKSSTDKNTNAGKKPTIGKKSNTSTPKGQYARYGVKCGIVKRIEDGGDIRMYYTTWWDDYGRLERSEITRCEEKVGGKWKSTSAPQIKNIIVDDKHYMYSKSTGWTQTKNNETNFLGSGSKTVDGCKLEKNGTATVKGKLCDIFKGKRNGTTIEYYIWEGIPMKRVEKDSDGTMTTTIESIELPASVDASLFKIPNVKR